MIFFAFEVFGFANLGFGHHRKHRDALIVITAMIARSAPRSVSAARPRAATREGRSALRRREHGLDGEAAGSWVTSTCDAVLLEELFVFGDPQRQHGAADRSAVGDAQRRGARRGLCKPS